MSVAPQSATQALPTRASALSERWLLISFSLWGVGVLSVEALASAGLALCCLWAVLQRPWRRDLLRAWAPLWAFLIWALVASTLAGRAPSGTGVARLADWLAIPLAAGAWPVLSARARRQLGYLLAAVFLTSCAVAALQHFGFWPRPEFFAPLAWTRFPFHRVYEPVPGAEGRFMAGGLLAHRLKFAHTGGLAVLVALVVGLNTRGRDRAVALVTAGLGAISVIAFPFARGATFALLACIPVALLLCLKRKRWALWGGAAVLLVGASVIALRPAARERFLSSFTAQGSGDRAYLLEAGVTAVRSFPWVGTGAGRFRVRDFGVAQAPTYVLENTGKSHNQLLSVAAEVGVPGLLLFLGALVAIALRFWSQPFSRAVGAVALLHFLLLSLAHDPLYQANFSMALALVLSFAAAAREPGWSKVTPPDAC